VLLNIADLHTTFLCRRDECVAYWGVCTRSIAPLVYTSHNIQAVPNSVPVTQGPAHRPQKILRFLDGNNGSSHVRSMVSRVYSTGPKQRPKPFRSSHLAILLRSCACRARVPEHREGSILSEKCSKIVAEMANWRGREAG